MQLHCSRKWYWERCATTHDRNCHLETQHKHESKKVKAKHIQEGQSDALLDSRCLVERTEEIESNRLLWCYQRPALTLLLFTWIRENYPLPSARMGNKVSSNLWSWYFNSGVHQTQASIVLVRISSCFQANFPSPGLCDTARDSGFLPFRCK